MYCATIEMHSYNTELIFKDNIINFKDNIIIHGKLHTTVRKSKF